MKYSAVLFLIALFSPIIFSQSSKPAPKKTPAARAKTIVANEKTELERALAQTDLTEKINALQKFIAGFPKSAERVRAQEILVSARAQAGEEKMRAGDISGGIALFKQAVADAPQPVSDKLFSEVVLQFPTNIFLRGQPAAAAEVARLIEEKIGGNAKQLLGLATFYLGTENAAEARRLAEKAAAIDPKLPAAYQTLGLANRLDFQLDDAAASYTKALEIDPDSAISKRALAEMKRALGKPDEAAALYREILKKNADDAAAQTGLTLALFDAGKPTEAEAELAKSLGKNSDNLILLTGAAYWYAAHNNSAKALDLAQKAVAVEPRYTWAHIALAHALIAQKQPLEAERTLLAARQYGNFPTLDYEIASARLAAGFYEEAARELRKSFIVKDDLVQTRLGNRVPKTAANFIELLALERRASIFEPLAADNSADADRLKNLLNFHQKISAADAADDEIGQAASAFTKGDDAARAHRELYAASRLLQMKRNLPQVLDLAQDAARGVDAALNVPNPSAAVLADELIESQTLALERNEVINVPEIPRQTLSAVLRGRIEEITGWTLFNQNKLSESVVHLKRAVSVLPEKSAWWRSSMWRLGESLAATGKPPEALDAYIKSYSSGAPDAVRYSVIQTIYQKVNGNLDGLEAKIGVKPADISAPVATQTEAKTDTAKVETPPAAASPVVNETPAAAPEISPVTPRAITNTKKESNLQATPAAKTESAESKPATNSKKSLFEPIIITVPKTEPTKTAENSDKNSEAKQTADAKSESDSCRLDISQESITITADGGNLGVLVGFYGSGDTTKITAVSSNPEDIQVSLEPDIGKNSNRVFFVVKSISAKTGTFTVTFDSPCGKKEIQVKVR